MANIINTYGEVSQFVQSALMGLGATETDPNGRYYLDGNMVNVELSRAIAEAIYIEEIFRDGQSVTGRYTTDTAAGAIRVMLDTPLPFSSRTIGFGGRRGTAGNAGNINKNAPLLPTNEEFMIYLTQVNDQSLLFPDLGKQYLPLDVVGKKVAGYASSVAQDRSASMLAEILAYNIFRALNSGGNIKQFSLTSTTANKYAALINDLNTVLDDGDVAQGAHTYPTNGRCIIGRPGFVNHMFSRESGVILQGGDLAQEMLKSYDLDARMENRNYVGNAYRGRAMQFDVQVAASYIWTLAEKYLGLDPGALDNVYAIATHYETNAMGRVIDLSAKTIDANEVRGVKVQPLNIWGHESFRKSVIIGADSNDGSALSTTSLASLGFSADERRWPVAPDVAHEDKDYVLLPIYNDAGAVVGYQRAAAAPKPHGGNMDGKSVNANLAALTVAGVTLSPTFSGNRVNYTGTLSDAAATKAAAVTATAVDSTGATVVIKHTNAAGTAATVTSGGNATFDEGKNTIAITVTNGEKTKVYTVVVTYTDTTED